MDRRPRPGARSGRRPDGASRQPNQNGCLRVASGASRLISYLPSAAGRIRVEAKFDALDPNSRGIIRMQLLLPDGSVAKEKVGRGPLRLSLELSDADAQKLKGK